MSETALLIMTRLPEKGKVKTRLARHIGEEATLQLYRAFLRDLALRFAATPWDLHWIYTPAHDDFPHAFAAQLAPVNPSGTYLAQQGEDLGERLLHAFQQVKAAGYQKIILISSDSPHISQTIISEARQALEWADVVLGPAEDGGYYLIAMREPHDLFSGIVMSTSSVLQETLTKAQEHQLRVHLVETLSDVDERSDLERMMNLLAHKPELAPQTAAYLTQLKKEPVQ